MSALPFKGRSAPAQRMGVAVRGLPKDVHGPDRDAARQVPTVGEGAAGGERPGRVGERNGAAPEYLAAGGLIPQKATGGGNPKLPAIAPDAQEALIIPDCYRPDAVEHIVNGLLAQRSLKQICADPDMPTTGVVREWLTRSHSFRHLWLETQRVIAFEQIGEIVHIADGDGSGNTVERDRLRIQARTAVAERLCPDTFAKKATGNGDPAPILGALADVLRAAQVGHGLPGREPETVDGEVAE